MVVWRPQEREERTYSEDFVKGGGDCRRLRCRGRQMADPINETNPRLGGASLIHEGYVKRLLTIGAFLVATILLTGAASGAVIKVGDLVLRADGGFEPQVLPRSTYAPINFQGYFDIASRNGGVPPALQEAVLEFDRNGRLSTTGLPSCAPATIANATPQQARNLCSSAIVGSGHLTAQIALPGIPTISASSPLTIFNGPPLNGNPTVVLHAHTTIPTTQTFAVLVPIERLSGAFSYRATIDVPPIAGGYGALTHIDAKIGRSYTVGGQQRSYVSARCSNGVLETHGSFTFAGGTILSGIVFKPCTPK
jgi:hypothetical protein